MTMTNPNQTPDGVVRSEVVPSRRTDGIYGLPVVGKPAQRVRAFYDDMQPQPSDNFGVIAGKQVLRYGAVVGAGAAGAAMAAVVVL
jgi:hypothetical protein